jgi:hypothetical protein
MDLLFGCILKRLEINGKKTGLVQSIFLLKLAAWGRPKKAKGDLLTIEK